MKAPFVISRNESNPAGRAGEFFKHLSADSLLEFESMEHHVLHSCGTVLFSEGQRPTDVIVVLHGEVKLSINSRQGRRLILRVAKPGTILGVSAVLSGNPYDTTAETLHMCTVSSTGRPDFLSFLARHPEAYGGVTAELSLQYNEVCEKLRNVGLTPTAPKKLARLLLDWSSTGEQTACGSCVKVSLTHEEIGECIGMSRETVTRTLAALKHKRLLDQKGSTMMIPNRIALEAYAGA